MSKPEPQKRTAAESRDAVLAMGVTDADICAVVDASPPLTDAQRERIAEISQPVLRRMRGKQPE
jgi:hypothetical protein